MLKRPEVAEEFTRDRIDRLVQEIDPEYFKSKRWFGSKSRTIDGYRVVELETLQTQSHLWCFLLLEIRYVEGESELYQLPLVFTGQEQVPPAIRSQPHGAAFVVRTPQGEIWAYDAFADDEICVDLYRGMQEDRELKLSGGVLISRHVPGRMEGQPANRIRRIATEQSNSSIVYDDRLIMKAFRKLSPGNNPDVEVPYFLTTHTDFAYVPKVAGLMEYSPGDGEPLSVSVVQDFVTNQGDCFTNAVNWVREYLEQVLRSVGEQSAPTKQQQTQQAATWTSATQKRVQRMGLITGLMHNALASDENEPAFRPEPITHVDIDRWENDMVTSIREVVGGVRARAITVPPEQETLLRQIAERENAFLQLVNGLNVLEQEGCFKIRCHGDYHLGQLLQTGDDFVILDFEGEPARSLAERRAKHCPLRDVAGMLRSFDYAAYTALFELWQERQSDEREREMLESWAQVWKGLACRSFVDGYREAIGRHGGPRFAPSDASTFTGVVKIFEIEKAFYELKYEFNNRPAWIPIPARGLLTSLRAEG